MTDIPGSALSEGEIEAHTISTLNERSAHCPPPPAERAFSYPSWKVIVSASRGQKLNRPGSLARPFFCLFSIAAANGNSHRSSFIRDSRNALPITLTDDSAIAAAPTIGDSRIPNTG